MIYEYLCENTNCEMPFEVVKTVAHMTDPEFCPKCGSRAEKLFSVPHISPTASDWGKEEYNPALGCVTKNARHRREIAKRKNLQEVGNDFGSAENMQKHFDEVRIEKRRKLWDDV